MNTFKRLNEKRHEDGGFTLVELLVVIVILGILSAVVVFAVGGITDKGKNSACKSDLRSLETAQEAFFAQKGVYAADEAALSPEYIRADSTSYNTTGTPAGGPFTGYTITVDAANNSTCAAP